MEETLQQIERYELELKKWDEYNIFYIRGKRDLKLLYNEVGNVKKELECCREIIELTRSGKLIYNQEEYCEIDDIILTCYDCLARNGDFESFMIAMEWNRKPESKFYIPRRRILRKHGIVQAMQDLSDGKYKILSISMSPRTRQEYNIFILCSI